GREGRRPDQLAGATMRRVAVDRVTGARRTRTEAGTDLTGGRPIAIGGPGRIKAAGTIGPEAAGRPQPASRRQAAELLTAVLLTAVRGAVQDRVTAAIELALIGQALAGQPVVGQPARATAALRVAGHVMAARGV